MLSRVGGFLLSLSTFAEFDVILFYFLGVILFQLSRLQAMSVSENWYVVRDQGTNYCNLYNLMEGETTSTLNEAFSVININTIQPTMSKTAKTE